MIRLVTARRARLLALGVVAAVLVWLIVTNSLTTYLARVAPQVEHEGLVAGDHVGNVKRALEWEHEREMAKLGQSVDREGMTMVPLKIYFNDRGRAKLLLAIAKGKKLHDKRETEKNRDWAREKSRLLKERG